MNLVVPSELKNLAPLLFDLIVVAILSGAAYTAAQWPFAKKLFPLTIAIQVLFIALGQLTADLRSLTRHDAGDSARPEERIIDIKVDRDIPVEVVVKRAAAFFGAMIGLFLLTLLIGLKVSVPIFLFGYLKFFSRASWPLTLILVALFLVLVFGLFDRLLNVPWNEGLLLEYFDIQL